MKYINLHCHTTYSLHDAIGYPKDLVEVVLQKEMNSVLQGQGK